MEKQESLLVKLLFFVIFISFVDGAIIKVTNITTCNPNASYLVTVANVDITERNKVIYVSGTLTANKDLVGPISADLTVKRYVNYVNVWLEIPCSNGIGSCSYNDLCHYGVSNNHSCPRPFLENNVPCRCPIAQGNYTMNSENQIRLGPVPRNLITQALDYQYADIESVATFLTGIYYVTASISDKSGLLTCYNIYFSYNDETQTREDELLNEVLPTVLLV